MRKNREPLSVEGARLLGLAVVNFAVEDLVKQLDHIKLYENPTNKSELGKFNSAVYHANHQFLFFQTYELVGLYLLSPEDRARALYKKLKEGLIYRYGNKFLEKYLTMWGVQ